MYKEILDALKAKFEGVSETVLGRIATRLAKTAATTEQVKPAVDGVTLQQLLDSYGDSRATEASQTAVRNYEQKYGLKDGKPSQRADPAPGQAETPKADAGDDTPEWAKSLMESNKALTERLGRLEGERVTAARRKQLEQAVSKLPEALRKPYSRIDIGAMTDEKFTELVGEVSTDVEGIVRQAQTRGAVFRIPGARGRTAADELTKEQKDAIAHRDGANRSGEGQPF